MRPQLTLQTPVVLFAAYALLGGITAVVCAIRNRKKDDDWWVMLLLGIVSTGAGMLAVVKPAATALVLVLVIGANALVTGVLDIVAAAAAAGNDPASASCLTGASSRTHNRTTVRFSFSKGRHDEFARSRPPYLPLLRGQLRS